MLNANLQYMGFEVQRLTSAHQSDWKSLSHCECGKMNETSGQEGGGVGW